MSIDVDIMLVDAVVAPRSCPGMKQITLPVDAKNPAVARLAPMLDLYLHLRSTHAYIWLVNGLNLASAWLPALPERPYQHQPP